MSAYHLTVLGLLIIAIAVSLFIGKEIYTIISDSSHQQRSQLERIILACFATFAPWGSMIAFVWLSYVGR